MRKKNIDLKSETAKQVLRDKGTLEIFINFNGSVANSTIERIVYISFQISKRRVESFKNI